MMNLNFYSHKQMSFYDTQSSLIDQATRLVRKHSFIGKRTTQQDIVPFDLDDVARAYDGTLTSIVRYLEAESSD
ncbi:MAG: hypothetical protein AAFV93_18360 [Chloroflexota bacterium]